MREAYHLYSEYFTTQGSNSNPALGQWAASQPQQKKGVKDAVSSVYWWDTQVSPLYCKKVVMYSEAQGAEQKQESKEMYIL